MIPNAWFYKLKDMSSKTRRNSHHQQNKNKHSSVSTNNIVSQKPQHHRQSFYYTWESSSTRPAASVDQNSLPDVYFYNFPAAADLNPPRVSSSKRRSRSRTRRKTVYKPSPRRVPLPVPGPAAAAAAALLHNHNDDVDDEEEEEEESAASFAPNSPQKNYFDSPSSATGTGTDADSSIELFDLLKYAAPSNNGRAATGTESRSSSCSCGFSSSAATTTTTTDIIIDINEKCFNNKFLLLDNSTFDTIPELDLPPILTKPTNDESSAATLPPPPPPSVKTVKGRKETANPCNGLRGTTTGIKLRSNSPKVGTKKFQGRNRGGRKSISSSTTKSRKKAFSESFAVVKASFDPQKDFRESMMEMILENKIRDSKDLEDLLACYLSLNSDEYHHLIINAFEQIWFKIPHLNF